MSGTCPHCGSPPDAMCKTPAGLERPDHVTREDTLVCCDLCLTYTEDTVSIETRIGTSTVCWRCRDKIQKAE